MKKPRSRPRYLTSKRAHAETMELLTLMHEHQHAILERMKHMTAATDRLTREVAETRTAILAKLAKMQEQIDILTNNPGDEAAVTAAADALDQLQTELVEAVETPPAPPAEPA